MGITKIIEKEYGMQTYAPHPTVRSSITMKRYQTNFEAYAKMHDGVENVHSMTSDRWSVCIGPSENGMEQVSFVNGLCTSRGGTHVDHVTTIIANGIIEDMAKKLNSNHNRLRTPLQSS